MPKKVDYPRASFAKALEMSDALDRLGGHATEDTLAAEMKMSVGGGFRAVVAAAFKFGLASRSGTRIESTDLASQIRLAYSEEEREAHLQEAFLSMPLFGDLHRRFIGKKLPLDILEKLLQKEFGVNRTIASRVGKYFTSGATLAGLLNRDTLIIQPDARGDLGVGPESTEAKPLRMPPGAGTVASAAPPAPVSHASTPQFSITSPSLSTTIALASSSDFALARAILSRLEEALQDDE